MPTSAEIAEYLTSEGLVDIEPWHDAEAISTTDPRARRARFAHPLTPGDPSHD